MYPLLSSLPHLVRLAGQSLDNGPKDDGPSLLVAIEGDSSVDGVDWREASLVRGLQVAQWTILAKPGHPVMMDVLGRALRTAGMVRAVEEEGRRVDVPDVVNILNLLSDVMC